MQFGDGRWNPFEHTSAALRTSCTSSGVPSRLRRPCVSVSSVISLSIRIVSASEESCPAEWWTFTDQDHSFVDLEILQKCIFSSPNYDCYWHGTDDRSCNHDKITPTPNIARLLRPPNCVVHPAVPSATTHVFIDEHKTANMCIYFNPTFRVSQSSLLAKLNARKECGFLWGMFLWWMLVNMRSSLTYLLTHLLTHLLTYLPSGGRARHCGSRMLECISPSQTKQIKQHIPG